MGGGGLYIYIYATLPRSGKKRLTRTKASVEPDVEDWVLQQMMLSRRLPRVRTTLGFVLITQTSTTQSSTYLAQVTLVFTLDNESETCFLAATALMMKTHCVVLRTLAQVQKYSHEENIQFIVMTRLHNAKHWVSRSLMTLYSLHAWKQNQSQ